MSMFTILVASQPARVGWLGSTTFSAVAHGTLITAALMTTGPIATPVKEVRKAVAEQIIYVTPRLITSHAAVRALRAAHAERAAREKPSTPNVPDVAAIQAVIDRALDLPIGTGEPDLTPMTMDWLVRPDALSTRVPTPTELVARQAALIRPDDGVYSMDMVEVNVEPRRGNPRPRYPSALRDMGIEGAFVVRFVVDSTGRVPDDKIDFPISMHRLFADAVRAALRRSQYLPALVGGRPVTEAVTQEFRFEMRKY
jgi:TonB family protein